MTCVSRRKICMTWPESLLGWSASEISPRTERNREKGCISPSSQSIRLEQKKPAADVSPFSPPENLLHCQKLCIVTFCPKNGGRGDFFGHFAPFSCYQPAVQHWRRLSLTSPANTNPTNQTFNQMASLFSATLISFKSMFFFSLGMIGMSVIQWNEKQLFFIPRNTIWNTGLKAARNSNN